MSGCAEYGEAVPLAVGGDLGPGRLQAFTAHLAECSVCASQVAEHKAVADLARGAFRRDVELPAGVRHRIAAAAAERVVRATWWSRAMDGVGLLAAPRPALAAATVGAIIVALIALPIALRVKEAANYGGQEAVIIDMQVQAGAVRVAWRDGRETSYRVRKSSDPRTLSQAETHIVKGNVWVDSQPESSPVVFYTIE